MNARTTTIGVALILLGIAITGCTSLSGQSDSQSSAKLTGAANGERIYFTGLDRNRDQIPYSEGPDFGGTMMGSYLTCASCHGPTASGGQHTMSMRVMYAPPINGDALNEMMVEESGGTPQPDGYSIESFRSAVVEGKHPDGDTLNTDMPRWQINDQDLGDLLAFLKTMPK
jgi:hypothetical protein